MRMNDIINEDEVNEGPIGAGLGGALGAVAGTAFGGPVGATIGAGLGGALGTKVGDKVGQLRQQWQQGVRAGRQAYSDLRHGTTATTAASPGQNVGGQGTGQQAGGMSAEAIIAALPQLAVPALEQVKDAVDRMLATRSQQEYAQRANQNQGRTNLNDMEQAIDELDEQQREEIVALLRARAQGAVAESVTQGQLAALKAAIQRLNPRDAQLLLSRIESKSQQQSPAQQPGTAAPTTGGASPTTGAPTPPAPAGTPDPQADIGGQETTPKQAPFGSYEPTGSEKPAVGAKTTRQQAPTTQQQWLQNWRKNNPGTTKDQEKAALAAYKARQVRSPKVADPDGPQLPASRPMASHRDYDWNPAGGITPDTKLSQIGTVGGAAKAAKLPSPAGEVGAAKGAKLPRIRAPKI